MRATLLTLAAAGALLVVACSASASPSPSGPGSSPGASTPAGSAAPSGSGAAGAWDPASISGTAVLSGWRSSPEEGEALTQTLLGFPAVYPKIEVDYQPIAGDYRTVMITKISSHEVPDLFYVNAEYAPEWIDQGFLEPLDDYIAKSGMDTSQFFEGYLDTFKGKDGTIYGLPKDGNTIALAYNSGIVTAAPTTMDELVTAAKGLKGTADLKAPMCLNPGLDRGLAFLYAQGGELLNADGTASAIQTDASKAAVQWYLDLFKDGLGMTPAQLGSGWCGEALGKKQVAMIFEGGWLDPAMTGTYPDVKYAWAEMPVGSSGKPVTISFTVSYSIGADSINKDQAFVLLSYLAGVDGMTKWTAGGVALPSRKDVPTPAGKDVLTKGSEYARPGSGFMPHNTDVQKAFQDAFTAQIQAKTYDAAPVVAATQAAIDKALNQ
jgi:multiple sugar transport system substrate-binding protein